MGGAPRVVHRPPPTCCLCRTVAPRRPSYLIVELVQRPSARVCHLDVATPTAASPATGGGACRFTCPPSLHPLPRSLPHSVRPEPPIRCAISLNSSPRGKLAADILLNLLMPRPCATPATRLRSRSLASHSRSTGISLLRLFWAYAPTWCTALPPASPLALLPPQPRRLASPPPSAAAASLVHPHRWRCMSASSSLSRCTSPALAPSLHHPHAWARV